MFLQGGAKGKAHKVGPYGKLTVPAVDQANGLEFFEWGFEQVLCAVNKGAARVEYIIDQYHGFTGKGLQVGRELDAVFQGFVFIEGDLEQGDFFARNVLEQNL